ncbi:MAG TPA: HAMP domain-containing sensor histidine kinase [Thermoanaerobaculia bacterium]|nr:HAMP domain-containing sensor histidine kinase [Thermoanaerobaculia bacterium]
MSWRSAVLTLCGALLAAAASLWLFERQISAAWFRLGLQPDLIAALERSLDDQKKLAQLDPERRDAYRRRFDETQDLLHHLRILEHNRQEILERYEMILLSLVGGILTLATVLHLVRQRRRERRIERLRDALAQLSSGRDDVVVGDRGRDILGRIAAMVEETSRILARDRRRLAALQNLSGWQETARRHAHEMKTPLTAARLELARLQQLAAGDAPPPSGEVRQVAGSVDEELDRLGRFAQELTSFARRPRPRRERYDLRKVVTDFAGTFAAAWPNLELRVEAPEESGEGELPVEIDREMIRRVLVNLCDNSSLARQSQEDQDGSGTVLLRLGGTANDVTVDVTDDGPGIAEEIRPRLFEPYATTRQPGDGMGLGLSIAKKILLDHGGDLELRETSSAGTTFRLLLPRPENHPEEALREGQP